MPKNSTVNNIAVRLLIPNYLHSDIETYRIEHSYREFNDALRYILKHFFSSYTHEVPEACFAFFSDKLTAVKLHINSNTYNSIATYLKKYPRTPDEKRLIVAIINFFFIIHKQKQLNNGK